MSAWQPIETAPKDGTRILGYASSGHGWYYMVVVQYNAEEARPWLEADGEGYHRYNVTHWMPLPEPPSG